MKSAKWMLLAAGLLAFIRTTPGASVTTLYTQTGTDPTWQQLLDSNAIPIGVTSTAGVTGSLINVTNSLVEVGPYKNNPIITNLSIHTLGNSSVGRSSFSKWSRWYQEDGKTQVFRLFKDEVNVRNDRPNAARIEAFYPDVSWTVGNGWQQWSGRYTIIKPTGAAIFQAKNDVNDWSVQIGMSSNGNITLNHRRGTDLVLATNMVGQGFDLSVFDNGLDYMVFFNGEYKGSGSWSRPTGTSVFRWGMYMGDNIPQNDAMIFVTGAKVTANAVLPTEVLAGWETWSSGNEAASKTSGGATGLAHENAGDWREASAAASNDGTFGRVAGATTSTGAAASGTYIGASNPNNGSYDFTITAGSNGLILDGFHFDAIRKRANSATTWSISSVAGDLTLADISTGSLGDALGGVGPTDQQDFDIDLIGLADHELAPGESATFRLAFSGGTYSNNDQFTYLDNVAITGLSFAVPEPMSLTLIGLAGAGLLFNRRKHRRV